MKRSTFLMASMALVFASATAFAQAKPNFAGKWTLIPDPNAAAAGGRGGMGGGLGPMATITQDEKTMTTTRTVQTTEVKSVYNLDGSDSKNTLNFGGTSIETVSKAKWVGDKLTISTSINFNGNAIETSATYSLDSAGNLIVENVGMGRGGAAGVTTKQSYKKG